MIIGLCGFIGSGKSTVSSIFVENYGFKQASFADSVKDCLSVIFGWDRNLLEGITQESRVWRETVDKWWSNKLNIPHFTPRFAMTHIATDIFRNHFDKNIWIYSLEKRLSESAENLIISDCRFQNEIQMLKKTGGKLIHVERSSAPSWSKIALIANNVDICETMTSEEAKKQLKQLNISPSEYEWIGSNYDAIVSNTKDKFFIQSQVEKIIEKME